MCEDEMSYVAEEMSYVAMHHASSSERIHDIMFVRKTIIFDSGTWINNSRQLQREYCQILAVHTHHIFA